MRRFLITVIAVLVYGLVHAEEVEKVEEVEVTIIDTGPGHASITKFANGGVLIFDTGHYAHDSKIKCVAVEHRWKHWKTANKSGRKS